MFHNCFWNFHLLVESYSGVVQSYDFKCCKTFDNNNQVQVLACLLQELYVTCKELCNLVLHDKLQCFVIAFETSICELSRTVVLFNHMISNVARLLIIMIPCRNLLAYSKKYITQKLTIWTSLEMQALILSRLCCKICLTSFMNVPLIKLKFQ